MFIQLENIDEQITLEQLVLDRMDSFMGKREAGTSLEVTREKPPVY